MNSNKIRVGSPFILQGEVAVDERGSVSFVNDFHFSKIKRFYVVATHRMGTVRAWHGHKREAKFVFVVSGSAQVGAVKIDNWRSPSKKVKVYRFLLSSEKPSILYIPMGYANGFKSLTKNTQLIFFSTKTFSQSIKDDIRYNPFYWNIWDTSEKDD